MKNAYGQQEVDDEAMNVRTLLSDVIKRDKNQTQIKSRERSLGEATSEEVAEALDIVLGSISNDLDSAKVDLLLRLIQHLAYN